MRVVKEVIWRHSVQTQYQNTFEKIIIKAPGTGGPTIAQDYTMTIAIMVTLVGLTNVTVV